MTALCADAASALTFSRLILIRLVDYTVVVNFDGFNQSQK